MINLGTVLKRWIKKYSDNGGSIIILLALLLAVVATVSVYTDLQILSNEAGKKTVLSTPISQEPLLAEVSVVDSLTTIEQKCKFAGLASNMEYTQIFKGLELVLIAGSTDMEKRKLYYDEKNSIEVDKAFADGNKLFAILPGRELVEVIYKDGKIFTSTIAHNVDLCDSIIPLKMTVFQGKTIVFSQGYMEIYQYGATGTRIKFPGTFYNSDVIAVAQNLGLDVMFVAQGKELWRIDLNDCSSQIIATGIKIGSAHTSKHDKTNYITVQLEFGNNMEIDYMRPGSAWKKIQ